MKKIKRFKSFLSIIMVSAMVTVMAAACGSKEEEAAKPDQVETEVADEGLEPAEESEVDTAQAEAPAEEPQGAELERQRMLEYDKELGMTTETDVAATLGVPEEKLQELYSSVANAINEEYLAKYNITPSDFEWPSAKGGQGVPKPWIYLSDKVFQKMVFYADLPEDPVMDLAEYDLTEADSQTIELMDIIYRQIIAWIQNNGYSELAIVNVWHSIILKHVTIG